MNILFHQIKKKYWVILFFLGYTTLCFAVGSSSYTKSDIQTILLEPDQITKLGEGHYLIAFKKAFFGTLLLKSQMEQKDSLWVHLGEKLSSEKVLDRNPGGTVRYQKVLIDSLSKGHTLRVLLQKDKRNSNPPAVVLPDSFGVIMPFRYCEVENLQIPINKIHFYQKAYTYCFHDEASSFNSSDTILNQIWDLCKHTIKATSFTGYYIDGDRERCPYEADAYINQLSHYCVDSVYSIARRTNEYFVNHPTWPTEWLLHTVMLYYQDYMYTGDVSAIAKHYDMLKLRTLHDLAREDGLISSFSPRLDAQYREKLGFKNPKTQVNDIVDWPPSRKETGWKIGSDMGERDSYDMVKINTVVNAFYYHNLILMAEIANYMHRSADVDYYHTEAVRVKKAINDKLFDKERGIYLDGEGSQHASLHANAFALAFNLVPEAHKESVLDFVKSKGMACSVYGAQYLLEALFRAHDADAALDLITDTSNDRTWWNMIHIGSTMTLEAWDKKYKPNLDWNHAWGTAPTNIITRHLWGITPATPGFKEIRVAPQMGRLTSSEIKVPTINGCILGKFKISNDFLNYTIILPKCTQGVFIIPNFEHQVLLSGKSNEAKKIKLHAGLNILKLKILKSDDNE